MKKTLIAVLMGCIGAYAQTLDRIVAVVGNEMILESELNAQTQFFVQSNKIDPKTAGLREQVLQSMINEKLILAKAIEDSVTVSEDDVTQQLDAVIQQRIQAAGSEQRLEELYGMPISRIKREYRDEMKKNLLSQRLQQQRFGSSRLDELRSKSFTKRLKTVSATSPKKWSLHIFL
ncbi:MAG: SurA N-terminal domain-containing protein [Bacteroidota bacterium]